MASTKGVSTLVASVLLIAFTVSVAMIVMGWFSSFAKTSTENVSWVTQTAIGCSAGIIEIDHIYIGSTTGNASISVVNSGQIPLTVNGIIVATNGSSCRSTTPLNISAGSTDTLNITTGNCPRPAVNFSSALLTTSCSGVTDKTSAISDISFI